jgi:hypothetical protein
MNKPWYFILNKYAYQIMLGYFICLSTNDYTYQRWLGHKDYFWIRSNFILAIYQI